MPVSASFRTFVLDQLSRVAPRVRARGMFGGVGIYSDDFFFALIDDDTVYLKVDDANRTDFLERGMRPFQPFGEEGEVMQYYALPEDVLEECEDLRPWVEKSVAAARRKKAQAARPTKRRKR